MTTFLYQASPFLDRSMWQAPRQAPDFSRPTLPPLSSLLQQAVDNASSPAPQDLDSSTPLSVPASGPATALGRSIVPTATPEPWKQPMRAMPQAPLTKPGATVPPKAMIDAAEPCARVPSTCAMSTSPSIHRLPSIASLGLLQGSSSSPAVPTSQRLPISSTSSPDASVRPSAIHLASPCTFLDADGLTRHQPSPEPFAERTKHEVTASFSCASSATSEPTCLRGGTKETLHWITSRKRKRSEEESYDVSSEDERRCAHCGTSSTPEWRRGPTGRGTLCNACGLKYTKSLRLRKNSKEADGRGGGGSGVPLSLLLNRPEEMHKKRTSPMVWQSTLKQLACPYPSRPYPWYAKFGGNNNNAHLPVSPPPKKERKRSA